MTLSDDVDGLFQQPIEDVRDRRDLLHAHVEIHE